MKHAAKKKGGIKKKIKGLAELVGFSSGSSGSRAEPPPSPPPASPPRAEDDEEDGWEDEEHVGGEYAEEDGGEDEEDISEDEGLGGLPLELDPNLAWDPPKEEVYVATDESLQPRERKPYRRGMTRLPKLKTWAFRDLVLVPAGKRYMLILAFHYRNFIIIEYFITYILILVFHCAECSSLTIRLRNRHVSTRTSLDA